MNLYEILTLEVFIPKTIVYTTVVLIIVLIVICFVLLKRFKNLKNEINDKEKAGLKIINRSSIACPSCNGNAIKYKYSDESISIICTNCRKINKKYFTKV